MTIPARYTLTEAHLRIAELEKEVETLRVIEHLVQHEWRLKDHRPIFILNSIEQALAAPTQDSERES